MHGQMTPCLIALAYGVDSPLWRSLIRGVDRMCGLEDVAVRQGVCAWAVGVSLHVANASRCHCAVAMKNNYHHHYFNVLSSMPEEAFASKDRCPSSPGSSQTLDRAEFRVQRHTQTEIKAWLS